MKRENIKHTTAIFSEKTKMSINTFRSRVCTAEWDDLKRTYVKIKYRNRKY